MTTSKHKKPHLLLNDFVEIFMNSFKAEKITTELVGELLVENESSSMLVYGGQSIDIYAIEGKNGTRRLLINSVVGENLIIDFSQ